MGNNGDLILIRGLPGAGKTTFAQMLNSKIWDVHIEYICTDDFFMVDGEYKFDPSKLVEFHTKCLQQVEWWMMPTKDGTNPIHTIFVHNTFTRFDIEMKPYYDLAKEYNWNIHSLIMENRHSSSNVHNVPERTIANMRDRFEVVL